jgi:hypothetical protein
MSLADSPGGPKEEAPSRDTGLLQYLTGPAILRWGKPDQD